MRCNPSFRHSTFSSYHHYSCAFLLQRLKLQASVPPNSGKKVTISCHRPIAANASSLLFSLDDVLVPFCETSFLSQFGLMSCMRRTMARFILSRTIDTTVPSPLHQYSYFLVSSPNDLDLLQLNHEPQTNFLVPYITSLPLSLICFAFWPNYFRVRPTVSTEFSVGPQTLGSTSSFYRASL